MKRINSSPLQKAILCFLLCAFPLIALQAQIKWPGGKKAAVMLTYDDGLPSQQQYVIPQLDKHHFHGTFFLYGANVKSNDIPFWRAISKRGHELGNHSIYHPCLDSKADTMSAHCRSLDCYTVGEMLNEIAIMNNLMSAIDGKSEHSYAYPCGQFMAGGEDFSGPMLKKGITKYARLGETQGVVNCLDSVDFAKVPAFAARKGFKAESMINYVKQAIDKGGFAVILFHGVGGDYLTVDAAEHQKLIDYLAAHKNDVWVGTFSEVLDYLSKQINNQH